MLEGTIYTFSVKIMDFHLPKCYKTWNPEWRAGNATKQNSEAHFVFKNFRNKCHSAVLWAHIVHHGIATETAQPNMVPKQIQLNRYESSIARRVKCKFFLCGCIVVKCTLSDIHSYDIHHNITSIRMKCMDWPIPYDKKSIKLNEIYYFYINFCSFIV